VFWLELLALPSTMRFGSLLVTASTANDVLRSQSVLFKDAAKTPLERIHLARAGISLFVDVS
jgi:hypothetical protein